ncbi:MAG: PD-(D/E)XK nuclease family protein [Planctomycetota bacterium]|nr:PD-(D/E)XK nuclease family protein [Planctomycetota bacterium]
MSSTTLHPSLLARNAALDAAGEASWGDADLTWVELLAALDLALPEPGGARRELNETARFALLGDAWASARARAPHAPAPTRGAVEALAGLLAAWKGAGLAPEHVLRASRRVAGPAAHLRETLAFVAAVWEDYERRLGAAWTDAEGRQRRLLERLRDARALPPGVLPGRGALRVERLLRLPGPHREVCAELARLGVKLEFAAAIDLREPAPGDPPLETLLRSFGPFEAGLAAPPASAGPARVRRVLAATPYAEVYEIGRRVRRWIEDEGVEPREIAVVFRDLGPYSQLLADVFRRLGLPYYLRRGEPAAFQPLVRVALTAMDAVRSELSREAVFRFLGAGPLDLARLSGVPGAPPAHELHRLALDARIDRLHGADLARPAECWAARLARRDRAGDERARLGAQALAKILERLDGLRAPRTRARFSADWREFWCGAGLEAEALRARLDLPRGGAEARRDAEAWKALDAALEQCAEGPGAGDEPVSAEAFATLFESAIGARHVGSEGAHRAGGVRVLNLYDLRGLSFKKVILGGLMEGRFPALPGPDPLLGGGHARALREALEASAPERAPLAGLEPRTPEEHQEEERALLWLAWEAVAPGGELLLARSENGADGKPAGASIFWDEPRFRAAAGEQVETATAVRPAPALAECELPEEAELRAAWILGGGYAGPPEAREAERAAAAALAEPPAGRMNLLLRRAAVEAERRRFFDQVALASARESGAEPGAVEGGPYDGLVRATDPDAPRVLEARWLHPAGTAPGAPALSPTALQSLAGCAFRFLGETVLRLDRLERPEEELSAPDRGSLWHEILKDFYAGILAEARARGRFLAVLDPTRRAAYLERLRALAGARLESAPQRYFTGHRGVWKLQRARIEAGLEAWLEREFLELAAAGDAPFHPALVEYAFGDAQAGSGPPVRIPEPGGARELHLRGVIDRLDLAVDDPEAPVPLVRRLRAFDYKTGGEARLKELASAEALRALLNAQLPVYLAAALNHLKAEEAAKRLRVDWPGVYAGSFAAYYRLSGLAELNRQEKSALVMPKDWPGDLGAYLRDDGGEDGLFARVRATVGAALQGGFLVRPAECAGGFCGMRFACRYRDLPAGGEDA